MNASWIAGLLFSLIIPISLQKPDAGEGPLVPIDTATAREIADGWRPIFRGVDQLSMAAEAPRRVRGQAVRIDLQTPGLRFSVSPSNGDRPLECDSITTSRFLNDQGLQLAINAAPFHPVVDDEGIPQDVLGVVVRDGEIVSAPQAGYGALFITADHQMIIGVQEPDADLSRYEHACGGFRLIVVEGRNIAPDDALHPRSAAALDAEGRHLILMAVDGRQPDHSLGLAQKELADWLLKLGAHTALNLDGGGSTSLVIQGPSGAPHILNQPIHKGTPGLERPCPNHLGLFLERLP